MPADFRIHVTIAGRTRARSTMTCSGLFDRLSKIFFFTVSHWVEVINNIHLNSYRLEERKYFTPHTPTKSASAILTIKVLSSLHLSAPFPLHLEMESDGSTTDILRNPKYVCSSIAIAKKTSILQRRNRIYPSNPAHTFHLTSFTLLTKKSHSSSPTPTPTTPKTQLPPRHHPHHFLYPKRKHPNQS